MSKSKSLSILFAKKPISWGLRGDPYLWREMNEILGDQPFPKTEDDLLMLLHQTYEQCTGKSIRATEDVFVERYSHGGMSSGYVSPRFWIETGFPFLLARYREAK